MPEVDLCRGTAWRCTDCTAGFDVTTADSSCWYQCGGQLLPTREIDVGEERGFALRQRLRDVLLAFAEFEDPFMLREVLQSLEKSTVVASTGAAGRAEDTTRDGEQFVALHAIELAVKTYMGEIEEARQAYPGVCVRPSLAEVLRRIGVRAAFCDEVAGREGS